MSQTDLLTDSKEGHLWLHIHLTHSNASTPCQCLKMGQKQSKILVEND